MSTPGHLTAREQAAATLRVIYRLGLSTTRVSIYYAGLSGTADEFEVTAYLHGFLPLPALQRDLIAHAVNELHDTRRTQRIPRAPYSNDPPHLHRPKP